MPGVLMIESLVQVATLLLPTGRITLRGVDHAKFRRQVVPGDRLQLEVSLARQRGQLVRATATASVDGQTVAEAELVLAVHEDEAHVDPAAHVASTAEIGASTTFGPMTACGPMTVPARGHRAECRARKESHSAR